MDCDRVVESSWDFTQGLASDWFNQMTVIWNSQTTWYFMILYDGPWNCSSNYDWFRAMTKSEVYKTSHCGDRVGGWKNWEVKNDASLNHSTVQSRQFSKKSNTKKSNKLNNWSLAHKTLIDALDKGDYGMTIGWNSG